MEDIKRIVAVTPMCVGVGEIVTLKVKVCGERKMIGNDSSYCTTTPRLKTWSNLAPRGSCFADDTLDGWQGTLTIDAQGALEGPEEIVFDGVDQGSFPGDRRAIKEFSGWRWTKPGIYHIRLTDRESGFTALSNPVIVTEDVPEKRAYFGDIHWQSYFTDGVRNPEELYFFARDEGFLDFGAMTDHSEGITDWQWDYMCAVGEDFNEPGRFSTLIGQEWTSFASNNCGHRNIYYRDGKKRPILRATDPRYDELDKLYDALKDEEALVIPHHSANVVMGVEWDAGHDPRLEKAVEIHSLWGSSEASVEDGNVAPIFLHGGSKPGRFVIDALRKGREFGFVGGGDIHCGRPGDAFDAVPWVTEEGIQWQPQHLAGFTGASLEENTRENIYDAMKSRATWATTQQRYYMEYTVDGCNMGSRLTEEKSAYAVHILCATNEPIQDCCLMSAEGRYIVWKADPETPMVMRVDEELTLKPGFYYPRITTVGGNMAWASPIWIGK